MEVKHGMRFRTIARTIRNKLDSWLNSIPDEKLRRFLADNAIVSGGCIASMAAGEGVNDYDVYFRTQAAAREAALYYASIFAAPEGGVRSCQPEVKLSYIRNLNGEREQRLLFYIKSAGAVGAAQKPYKFFECRPDFETENFVDSLAGSSEATNDEPEALLTGIKSANKGDYAPLFFSNNAVTLQNDVQIVIRFHGEPAELHVNYDFAHCMGSYDYAKDLLRIPPDAMQCILERTLVYKGSLYPLCSLLRLRKFLSRGWRIDAGELLKIARNAAMVDFEDPDMLQEQLMGVDAAYMRQFILAMREAIKSNTRITPTYFAQLIDKIYD